MSAAAQAPPPAEEVTGSSTRVKAPTVLQMQVTECGAAALGMVLAHYGRWVPLEELRERCGASRDGTTASDLVKAGAEYGLSGKGYFRRRGLLAPLGFPLILLWKGNHFVVLEGLDENSAWLNDPASGQRQISIEEFDRDYSKICLAFRPTESFAPGGHKPARFRAVLRRGRPVLSEVLAVVTIGLLATIPGLAVAAVAKIFVDDVLIGGLAGRAWPLVGVLALLVAIQGGLQVFQQRVLIRLGSRLTVAESARFVYHALRLPERYFIARSVPRDRPDAGQPGGDAGGPRAPDRFVATAGQRAGRAHSDHCLRRHDDGDDQGRRPGGRILSTLGGHRRPARGGAPGYGEPLAGRQLDSDPAALTDLGAGVVHRGAAGDQRQPADRLAGRLPDPAELVRRPGGRSRP